MKKSKIEISIWPYNKGYVAELVHRDDALYPNTTTFDAQIIKFPDLKSATDYVSQWVATREEIKMRLEVVP